MTHCLECPSREPVPPDHTLLFQAIPSLQNGGCRVLVWLPKESAVAEWGRPLPVALMFHGGGWMMGSADMIPYNQVRYLLSKGIAVLSCEYRMLPHYNLEHIRHDILGVYHYIQKDINVALKEAGAIYAIDGVRACAMGWSAGASVVLWLAQEIQRYNSRHVNRPLPPLRAIVTTYPFTKLDAQPGARSNLEAYCQMDFTGETAQSWEELKASTPSASFKVHPIFIEQRHSALSPGIIPKLKTLQEQGVAVPSADRPPPRVRMGIATMMAQCLSAFLVNKDPPFDPLDSPVNIANPEFPPTAVVVAKADALIPLDHSHDFYEQLQLHGVDSLLVECEGMQHGEAECLSGSSWDDRWWSMGLKPSLDFAVAKLEA